jgi:hypothetical protein
MNGASPGHNRKATPIIAMTTAKAILDHSKLCSPRGNFASDDNIGSILCIVQVYATLESLRGCGRTNFSQFFAFLDTNTAYLSQ